MKTERDGAQTTFFPAAGADECVVEHPPVTVEYFGVVAGKGLSLDEVLITRQNGRQVSQKPTGISYKTMREAMISLQAKNEHLSNGKTVLAIAGLSPRTRV